MMWNKIITNLGNVVLFINVLLFLRSYFMTKEKKVKILFIYLVIILFIQLLSNVLFYFNIPNLIVSHFYFVIQFSLLSWFYREVFVKKRHKRLVEYSFVAVLLMIILSFILNPDYLTKFNIYEIVLTTVPLVFYSILHIFNSLSSMSKSFSYLNMGVLFYLLTSTIIFISGNVIIDTPKLYSVLIWYVNMILYLLYQITILIEWWKNFSPRSIKYSR